MFANVLSSLDEYRGPLSLITTDGIPCLAKADLMWAMTVVLMVSGSLATVNCR